ncbi:hypothetical protein C0J52_06670 [Blattella germanica]|nr:hypothetical protein C0J52_06670 [Blattella germanica]
MTDTENNMSMKIFLLIFIACLVQAISANVKSNEEKWSKVAHRYQNLYKNSYYFVYKNELEWLEASNYCGAEGAHLVVINSAEESEVVAKVMASGSFRLIHAGFHDLFIEGDYMTVTGQPLAQTGFSTWYDGEPTDDRTSGLEEDCGMIYSDGTLGDQPCTNQMAFICEHEI